MTQRKTDGRNHILTRNVCDHNVRSRLMVPILYFPISIIKTDIHSLPTQPIGNPDPLTYKHRKFHLQQEVLNYFKLFPFSHVHLSSSRETGLGYRAG